MTHKTDVCIVGSGPAGLVTSLFLSKHGVKHILTERSVFPRDKVCGEFYDGRLRNVLNKLNTSLFQRMKDNGIIQDIHQYLVLNAKLQQLDMNATANARVSTVRAGFDNFLLHEALKSPYVAYMDDTRIEDVTINADSALLQDKTGKVQIVAQLAVIATGSRSALARQVMPQNKPDKHFLLAARAYFSGLPVTEGKNCCRLILLKKPAPCYLGTVDLPGGLALIEVFILKDTADRHGINPKALLKSVVEEYAPLQKLLSGVRQQGQIKGASLPATSARKVVSASRILLAGDSGYNINPLTGLGVGRAVYSGMCAAEQCVQSLEANDFSGQTLSAYDARLYKAFKADGQTGRFGDFVLKSLHPVPHGLISLVSSSPYLKRKAAEVLNKF